MRELKDLSKVLLVLNKNQGEILLSTSYESLYKHGYRPYVRWGVLNETLAAACILESGVLDRAKHTGKLYLWDPFCGSGSFLIEALMYALEQPVRELAKNYPFEHWPVH
jgi:23S rRNA G2445 N2-methylase RlmL